MINITIDGKQFYIMPDHVSDDFDDVIQNPENHLYETELEAAEAYAEEAKAFPSCHKCEWPTSEQDLSDRYDQHLEELGQTDNFEHEYFNNWKDSEQTEGRLHKSQDDNYEYTGRYDND